MAILTLVSLNPRIKMKDNVWLHKTGRKNKEPQDNWYLQSESTRGASFPGKFFGNTPRFWPLDSPASMGFGAQYHKLSENITSDKSLLTKSKYDLSDVTRLGWKRTSVTKSHPSFTKHILLFFKLFCSYIVHYISAFLCQVPNALDKLITAFCLFHVKLNSPVWA